MARGVSVLITLFCTALILSAAIPVNADEVNRDRTAGPAAQQLVPLLDPFEVDGTHAEKIRDADVLDAAVLTSMIAWVSNISNLPATEALPAVRLLPVGTTVVLQSLVLLEGYEQEAMSYEWTQGDLTALYDDGSKTIYLPEQWSGVTAAEMSMLAHAMVHHLQNVAHVTYACPQLRNAVAYDSQARWLGLFELTMADEFKFESDILLVSTQCIP